MLEMTKPVVEAANQEDPGLFVDVATQEMGNNTLRAHAAALVVEGKTTLDEAMRISNQFDD
jgi:MSHA biogenesis protein MshE